MPMQFVGYHIDEYNPDKSVSVATGATRDEAMVKTVRRILSAGGFFGLITVQQRDDVPK
jgi:hypothetical protein